MPHSRHGLGWCHNIMTPVLYGYILRVQEINIEPGCFFGWNWEGNAWHTLGSLFIPSAPLS